MLGWTPEGGALAHPSVQTLQLLQHRTIITGSPALGIPIQPAPFPPCFPCTPSRALPFLQAAPKDFSSALMFLMSPWRVCCHFPVAYLGVLVLNEAGKDQPYKALVHHLIHGLSADICRDRKESESCPAHLQDWGKICHLLKGDLEFGNKYHKLYLYILSPGDLSLNKKFDAI